MKGKSVILLLLSVILIFFFVTGCNSSEKENNNGQSINNQTTDKEGTTSQSNEVESETNNTIAYPIDTNETLEYWMEFSSNLTSSVTNFGDTPFAKLLEEKTGIKVEYFHPPVGNSQQINEALMILLASGDLPDIIEYSWYGGFAGGPAKALSDGYIIELNEVIDNYAPNFKNYLEENPQFVNMIKTDEQKYYVFPFLKGDDRLTVTNGPIIRADWIKELNLETPETIDEWYSVLKAFKDEKKVEAPYSSPFGSLTNCFGPGFDIIFDFYQENGVVKFGLYDPNLKDFYLTMNAWYKEGLIDRNIAVIDSKTLDSKILNGKAGATHHKAGGGLGKWLNVKDGDSGFDLMAVPYPASQKGQKPKFGTKSLPYPGWGSAAVTSSCDNVELAVRYLDFGYSEEGIIAYNFGREGQSFNMENGYPKYTDLIKNNPDGLTLAQSMSLHFRAADMGPFPQDIRYLEQYYSLPQQINAVGIWADTLHGEHMLPNIVFNMNESSERARLFNDLVTYGYEMFVKYIMGNASIDTFDEYMERMKEIGVEELLSIYQAAYDRYEAR